MLDRLFSPLTINGKTLKNRCVVTPMLMNFCEEDGTCTERFAAYHEAKAKGGFAMIVTENVAVTSVAKGYQWIPGLWKDEHIPGFRDLTDRVHQYDTVIIAQLNHPGRQASEKYAKAQSWAPSAIPDPYHNEEMPHEMTIAEIHKTVEDFGDAALRAKKAGFDGIELHGAHGYMIPEFMSMYTNKRTDEYGGDLTNRMRFALEIIENVRQKCGPDFILGYRLSADERVTGGLTIEDTKAIVPYLDQAGVDYFSISIAVNATDDQMIPSMYYRHGYQADYAKEVKDVTCKPVITVGRINDTRIAESILRSHKADLIGFARQSLTDPETPNKAREGRFEDIRKCVGCLHGCVGHIDTGLAGSCELNPLVGHESDPEYQTVPAEHPKKVMVVGAGPAGMQAAIAAAECGHQVEVYDSDRWAGGQYKTVLILIPILVLVILFYPNVDKDRSLAQAAGGAQETETVPARDGKFPMVAVGMLLLYLFGAIFWNAWFMNYSDYIVNEAQLGTTAMAGVIGSLCSVAGTVSGLVVAFWIKATKRFSMTLAFILCGVAMLLPQLTQSAAGCYAGGILCQFFNLIVVSGLTTYLGLATTGKNATTAMSLLAGIEGSGVFLCGYIVPVVGNLFGGGAGMNIMVSGIILMVIGVAAYFVIKPTHEMVYGKKNTDQQHG